jgi:8-oxo-dGTP diphosphatase
MSARLTHCTQCGHELVSREVQGRRRLVCPACDAILYQNPLPVAAAAVLNERREVLLVKRKHDPYRGRWCLPMGFAELGETIAEAALRELAEETRLEGTITRLLDAHSQASPRYGELLVVTFEIARSGGRERAGDDAAELRYFPIGHHPPLAFAANEHALRICAEMHLEGWEIEDSFLSLQRDEQDRSLLSDALVQVVQSHAEQIAERWLAEVRTNNTTTGYRAIDPRALQERATRAISQFGRWFRGAEADQEVRALYATLAAERRQQGVELHELLSSLALLKKHLWLFLGSQGVWARPIEVYRVLELNRRMAVFFDKASYYAARGFSTRDAGSRDSR